MVPKRDIDNTERNSKGILIKAGSVWGCILPSPRSVLGHKVIVISGTLALRVEP